MASFREDLELKQISLDELGEDSNCLEISCEKVFEDLKVESVGSNSEFAGFITKTKGEVVELDFSLIKGKFTVGENKIRVEDRKVQLNSVLEVEIVFNEETEEFFNKNLIVEMVSEALSSEKEELEEEESLLGKKRKLSSDSESEGFFPKTQKKEEEMDSSQLKLDLESYLESLK